MDRVKSADSSIHIFSVGPFGVAVAKYLKGLDNNASETEITGQQIPQNCCTHHINVLAAWRPVVKLCESLDQTNRQSQRSFIPLVAASGMLQLGPVVVMGSGACWQCWMRRSAQHSLWPKQYLASLEFYSTHPYDGPEGYLEPVAMLSAVKIKQVIDALHCSSAKPGYIWQMDVITRHVMEGVVVGVHGCSSCGLQRAGRTRSVDEMELNLTGLWQYMATGGDKK